MKRAMDAPPNGLVDLLALEEIERNIFRSGSLGPLMMASLDHAIWFHRDVRADDWLLLRAGESYRRGRARVRARHDLHAWR